MTVFVSRVSDRPTKIARRTQKKRKSEEESGKSESRKTDDVVSRVSSKSFKKQKLKNSRRRGEGKFGIEYSADAVSRVSAWPIKCGENAQERNWMEWNGIGNALEVNLKRLSNGGFSQHYIKMGTIPRKIPFCVISGPPVRISFHNFLYDIVIVDASDDCNTASFFIGGGGSTRSWNVKGVVSGYRFQFA